MNLCKVTQCPHHSKCPGYCLIGAGYTASQFIANCDVVESKIGSIHSTIIQWKKVDALVCGAIYEKSGEPAIILSQKKIPIVKEDKFRRYLNKSMGLAISSYFNLIDEQGQGQLLPESETVDKLQKILNDRLMIIPFKIGVKCLVLSDKYKDWVTLEVEKLIYGIDMDTGRIEGSLVATNVGGRNPFCETLKISDYGKRFRLSQVEDILKSSNIDRKCIMVSPYGWIKPVIFENEDLGLAVDGSYVYLVRNNNTSIVGRWKPNGEIEESEQLKGLSKTSVYKALNKHLNFISLHRKYIAPYIFAAETRILVTSKTKKEGATSLVEGKVSDTDRLRRLSTFEVAPKITATVDDKAEDKNGTSSSKITTKLTKTETSNSDSGKDRDRGEVESISVLNIPEKAPRKRRARKKKEE